MDATTVAIDLAKDVFQVAISHKSGQVAVRRRLSRRQFALFVESLSPGDTVVMETCGTAHYWGRRCLARGAEVRLLPAHYVRPYVRRDKTDRADADALLEANRCAAIHPVPVKTTEQQTLQVLHRARTQWQAARTARINAMRGMLRRRRSLAGTAAAALLLAAAAALLHPAAASAQTVVADGTALPAALSTRLAFVRSGDPRIDQVSAAGLVGLSSVVNRRTAAELGEPVGIDPETDEIAFYPLLYWPIGEQLRPLSPRAARRLTDYMRNGGTIVFDTRGRGDGSDRAGLRDLARALDLPPLIPVAEDNVLRRSYYLLGDLPGRRAGGTVWIESSGEHVNDGVSSVVAGSNDWAGAWAIDDAQRPLFAVTPGGERQREQAYRFGVNLVMYVLTGNYKADQVHTSTILERLGP